MVQVVFLTERGRWICWEYKNHVITRAETGFYQSFKTINSFLVIVSNWNVFCHGLLPLYLADTLLGRGPPVARAAPAVRGRHPCGASCDSRTRQRAPTGRSVALSGSMSLIFCIGCLPGKTLLVTLTVCE